MLDREKAQLELEYAIERYNHWRKKPMSDGITQYWKERVIRFTKYLEK